MDQFLPSDWFLDEDGKPYPAEPIGPNSSIPGPQLFPTPFFKVTDLKSGKPVGKQPPQGKVLIANAGGMPHNTPHEWQLRTEVDHRLAINSTLVAHTSENSQLLGKKKEVYLPKGQKVSPRMWEVEWTPEGVSSIEPHTVSHVFIHRAYLYEPKALAKETERVCTSGGGVALIGLQRFEIGPEFDWMTREFEERLAPYRTSGEQHYGEGWRRFPVALNYDYGTAYGAPALFAEAVWSLNNLVAFMKTWPSVTRMQENSTDFSGYAANLKAVWGSPKKKRLVRLPVIYRTGFLLASA